MSLKRLHAALLAAFAAGLLCMAAATADDPADVLPNPAQEARARHLFQQLRCVQCQNESIDDSQAPIAQDLRRIVRRQIATGRTDPEVMGFLVQRYGEFILLRPALDLGNLALWLTPFALILVGGGYLWIKSRRPAVEDQALTEDEHRALAAIGAEDQEMLAPPGGSVDAPDMIALKH